MSYFIANSIEYNQKEDKIYVKGGSNNVTPRSNNWDSYQYKEYLLKDLISGGLQLKSTNALAVKCLAALKEIKTMHKKQFGKRQDEFKVGQPSINPYSLYMISSYDPAKKEETLKWKFDMSHISESYWKECTEEAEAIKGVYDEGALFYAKAEKLFFDRIGIALKPTVTTEQLLLTF